LAAYNAGPSRARRWRDAKALEGAVYVESIPFPETRDYVKKVMANSVFYAAVLDRKLVPLKARLGVILPPGAVEPPVGDELP
jgi:soluble lytic murein transglycosylase